ncbi:MAG: SH3 beta-barrel fold-containing protein [Candidatus Nanoarchaeia archaeon]|jgi:hypothetical protein|nr:SH3 beta-barrel fold-containing protein [Candidatus Nanoarchaeia archaeon]
MMFNISIDELKVSLQGSSPVWFTYVKTDGSTVKALGTLNKDLIPEEFKPKDSSRNTGENVKYFDLNKNAWRSLRLDCSIVTIIE